MNMMDVMKNSLNTIGVLVAIQFTWGHIILNLGITDTLYHINRKVDI